MKSLYNLKITHLIIILFLILFLINFNFYNHIFLDLKQEINNEKLKIKDINQTIHLLIKKFNKSRYVFNQIKELENKIMENEYEIGYLKNKNKTKEDILDIFREVILKSNTKLSEIKLISDKNNKETGEILFEFKGSAKIDDFISLLDIIENGQEFLTIESYKLKNIKLDTDSYSIEMILKFVYVI